MATSSISSSNEEWVPAQEAAMLLARSFGGQTVAKQAVALALREGILRARAEWSIWLEEGDEEPKELEATADHPIEIEAATWCSSINWEADRLGWDWTEGCFDVEGHFAEDDKAYGGVSFLQGGSVGAGPTLPNFQFPGFNSPAGQVGSRRRKGATFRVASQMGVGDGPCRAHRACRRGRSGGSSRR